MALSLSRILLSLLFIVLGYADVFGFSGANMQTWIAFAKSKLLVPGTTDPLPNPELLAQIAAYGQLVGGLMLFIGILSRLSAFGLLLFTIAASVLGHNFWTMADPQMAYVNIGQFLKNMGIIGGLFLIVVYGGGSLSIDGMFRRQPM